MGEMERISSLDEACSKAESWPVIRKLSKNNDELDRLIGDALDLGDVYTEYQAKKNPLHLMKAFEYAWERNFTVPIWVQSELVFVFRLYHLFNGKKSLDELLKVSGRGFRGSPFKRIEFEKLERRIAYDVASLRDLGFTLRVACSLVSFRSKSNYCVSIGQARIEELYKHYRSIEGGNEWFGELWQNELKSPNLCIDFMLNGGFLLDSDSDGWPVDKDNKLWNSYRKTREKIVNAYLETF